MNKNQTQQLTLDQLPSVPFRANDKSNKTYCNIVVTKVLNDSVQAHTTFADGYNKFERVINLKNIELLPEHKCNPDSFNKHCQICGCYCG